MAMESTSMAAIIMTRLAQPFGRNMQPEEIQQLIETHLPESSAMVASGDLRHYEATVISPAFSGKRPLQRHQLVYAALGERIGREIHALSIAAFTPEEWQARSR